MFEKFIEKLWYRPNIFCYLLLPASWLYCLITALHRLLYRAGIKTVHHFPIPIIVVGNINVGGTGKTPLVIWLVEFLRSHGHTPAIVSRGYKSKAPNYPYLVTANSAASVVGDEALLLAERCQCPIAIDRNRPAAVKKIIADHPECNIIISDDGLQHYALHRDLEIVVIDGTRRFGNGFCLPAGPLREPKSRLQDVDFIVTNGKARRGEYEMNLTAHCFYKLTEPNKLKPPTAFKGKSVHAVAGIGNPARFFATLHALGIKCIKHPFPDHHVYTASNLDFGDKKTIIMTEKDAVKCRGFGSERCWVLRVEAILGAKFQDRLLEMLTNNVGILPV